MIVSVRYSQYRPPLSVINISIIANNTSIFKTNLPSLTSATLLYSFRRFFALRKVLKFTKSCKNTTCKK